MTVKKLRLLKKEKEDLTFDPGQRFQTLTSWQGTSADRQVKALGWGVGVVRRRP